MKRTFPVLATAENSEKKQCIFRSIVPSLAWSLLVNTWLVILGSDLLLFFIPRLWLL